MKHQIAVVMVCLGIVGCDSGGNNSGATPIPPPNTTTHVKFVIPKACRGVVRISEDKSGVRLELKRNQLVIVLDPDCTKRVQTLGIIPDSYMAAAEYDDGTSLQVDPDEAKLSKTDIAVFQIGTMTRQLQGRDEEREFWIFVGTVEEYNNPKKYPSF